jgi:hypothetical protein
MNVLLRQRSKCVIGPDGSPSTMADLAPAGAQRWTIRRNAEVVAFVRDGQLSHKQTANAASASWTDKAV